MPLTWSVAFHSGMSSSQDLRAAVDEGVPVGVVATLLDSLKIFGTLPRHLNAGGSVFIDSGAFSAFQKGELVSWEKVFFTYECVLARTDFPGALSIVAPDIIGDQSATLDLWAVHAERVRTWIMAGARVIIPLQCGELSAGVMLAHAKRIFQTDQFCAGIPSNLAAMSAEDCATLHHHDFHLLGRVVINAELGDKLRALLANNPDAIYTADANWLRSRIRQISLAAKDLRQAPPDNPFESSRTRAVRAVLRQDAYHQKQGWPSGARHSEMIYGT
ncbi:hypothetical protein LU689_26855 [Pseudomonas asiatica]|uniref:hypothetical protein n=1 Tax=Pseudomonas asiatica TaxID=2219225 RepID=UPI001E4863E2|nr:hypothetical protein [Pseudomonas asiatica]MCE0853527.1 hypothetical protein [Pseudomonas asiatica]